MNQMSTFAGRNPIALKKIANGKITSSNVIDAMFNIMGMASSVVALSILLGFTSGVNGSSNNLSTTLNTEVRNEVAK